jgi:hypothetical protein
MNYGGIGKINVVKWMPVNEVPVWDSGTAGKVQTLLG